MKGVTYGPFAPNDAGEYFASVETTRSDFGSKIAKPCDEGHEYAEEHRDGRAALLARFVLFRVSLRVGDRSANGVKNSL